MKTILVTGSRGFIGKNLMEALSRIDCRVTTFDSRDEISRLRQLLAEADFIYHLAGVNRPDDDEEFDYGNAGLTHIIVTTLGELDRSPTIVFSSSVQACSDNPYGLSKKKAEDILCKYGTETKARVLIYRLANVFGKWARPNYNSVIATFCYNISRGIDINVSDRQNQLQLIYIDDVLESFTGILRGDGDTGDGRYRTVEPSYRITLGELADRIYSFRDIHETLFLPDMSDTFIKHLYTTYLSYLDKSDFSCVPDARIDERGSLVELFKSDSFGQIFISRTYGGIIRGNHYHNSKVEKFCVVEGDAVIRLRNINSEVVHEYHVSGEKIELVDIPPGYTHSIENLSDDEMIVLFWTNEVFDPLNPDTYFNKV